MRGTNGTNGTKEANGTKETNRTNRTSTAARTGLFTLGALLAATLLPAGSATAAPPRLGTCAAGELCLWGKDDFTGSRWIHELSGLDIDSCVPLPAGATAASLANRTGRPVTTYQSAECAETGEFETYPGGGTWVPRSPYRVRAFKVWET